MDDRSNTRFDTKVENTKTPIPTATPTSRFLARDFFGNNITSTDNDESDHLKVFDIFPTQSMLTIQTFTFSYVFRVNNRKLHDTTNIHR